MTTAMRVNVECARADECMTGGPAIEIIKEGTPTSSTRR